MRDTAGYDDTVVLHEYGHFAVLNYSRRTIPPSITRWPIATKIRAWRGTRATPRIFGSGAARRRLPSSQPVRAHGRRRRPGHLVVWFDLETESQFSCSGDKGEVAIFTAMWDITDSAATDDLTPGVDDTPVDNLALAETEQWQVMTSGLPGSSYITAEDYWDKWFASPISNGFFTEMRSIFADGVEINFYADAFESNETQATAKPVAANASLIHLTLFTDPDGDRAGGRHRRRRLVLVPGDRRLAVHDRDDQPLVGVRHHVAALQRGRAAPDFQRQPRRGDASSLVNWTPATGGTYYVKISRVGTSIKYGSYDLRISPPPTMTATDVRTPSTTARPLPTRPANVDADTFG
jgi:hypothetical protein